MANLIEYIQSQIYENSTEDISGSIMQQVLTRMASDEGVVNVHTISGQTPFADYNNAQAARNAVPDGFKKLGLIITYKLSSGWYIDEFIGSATSGWSTASNWKCLGPISVSQNASTGKTTITIGSESYDVATQPVSVSQNTNHYKISVGSNEYDVVSAEEVDGKELVTVNKTVEAESYNAEFSLPIPGTLVEKVYKLEVGGVTPTMFRVYDLSRNLLASIYPDTNPFLLRVPATAVYWRVDFAEVALETDVILTIRDAGLNDYATYLLDEQIKDKPTITDKTLKIGGSPTNIKEVEVVGNRLNIGGSDTNITMHFVNINALKNKSDAYTSKSSARTDVPSALRIAGLKLCYLLEINSTTHESMWYCEEFIGTDVSGTNWTANNLNWQSKSITEEFIATNALNMDGAMIGDKHYKLRDSVADADLFTLVPLTRTDRLQNYSLSIDGVVESKSNWQIWYYAVTAGKKYRIKLYTNSSYFSRAAYFANAPTSGATGTVVANSDITPQEMAEYADYVCNSNGYIAIATNGNLRNDIGFYEVTSNLQSEISNRLQMDNISSRDYERINTTQVSGNFDFTNDSIVESSVNGRKLYYIPVVKGQIVRLSVGETYREILKYGFTSVIPASNVSLYNAKDISTLSAIEEMIICPIDGYLALNMWYDRTKEVYNTEFGSNDYFLRADYLHKLASLKRTFNNNSSAYKTLILLLGSDPHAELDTFTRFMAFGERYKSYFDDIVVNGDVVASKFGAAGNDMPFDSVEGFEDVLLSIGNHDCYDWDNLAPSGQEYSSQYEATNEQKYNRYMKNIANWGVVQPTGVDDSSSPYYKACYYYKDYDTDGTMSYDGQTLIASKVRLIVLDSMDTGNAQTTWLESVLSDAKTNGLHVICMEHIINNTENATIPNQKCGWSEDYEIPTQSRGHASHLAAVQDFIDAGGVFICWIHGHTHVYQIGTFDGYPKQLYINLGATFRNPNYGHREAERLAYDASFDNFTVLSVDSLRKSIRLLKVGCEFDRDLKHRGTMLISYGGVGPELIYES